jgi:hypothetical protein
MEIFGNLFIPCFNVSYLVFLQQLIQPYIMSLTSMEVDHVLEAAKDVGGARTIEAFLDSDASGKQKHRLINKYVMLRYWLFLFFRSFNFFLVPLFLVEQ